MIYTMRCCRWIVNSLRSICCEEYSSSRIPPDPNETSAMARHAPTQYSSDTNKGLGLPTVIKQVAYIGLFLLERALEWFEPYFTKIQPNKISTINIEV